jgi:hypothetical protein
MKIRVEIKPFKLDLGKVGGGDSNNRWGGILDLFGKACLFIVEDRIARGETIDGEPMLTGPERIHGPSKKRGGKVTGFIGNKGAGSGSTSRYSYQYEAWKAGRKRALYTPGDRFNVTGAMMRAWRVLETTATMVRVGFTSTREALKAWGNHIRRPTFALSGEESRQMVKEIMESVGLKVDG